MLVSIIVVVSIILDQITKFWIQNHVEMQNVTVIPHFFHLTYAENTGMAWSLLSGKQAFLCLAAAVAIGVMIWYIVIKNPDKPTKCALALMIGGAAGNLADRLFLGAVRDFMDFYIFGYDFPIFNVADSALTIGVILLMLAAFKEEKEAEKAKETGE